jgi:LacI family transcriptional regulator
VDVDNRNSSREAVMHLFRHGCKRVGTIAGPSNMIGGIDRLEGYKDALKIRGLVPEPALIVEGDFSEGGGYSAMMQLLPQRPDAVFIASDAMALGALRALRQVHLRVPEDVALVSFDDMPFACHAAPPLTSVRQPIHRAGYVAAETVMDLLNDPEHAPRRVILPTELVIRDSCGPHPSIEKRAASVMR